MHALRPRPHSAPAASDVGAPCWRMGAPCWRMGARAQVHRPPKATRSANTARGSPLAAAWLGLGLGLGLGFGFSRLVQQGAPTPNPNPNPKPNP